LLHAVCAAAKSSRIFPAGRKMMTGQFFVRIAGLRRNPVDVAIKYFLEITNGHSFLTFACKKSIYWQDIIIR
jgi:hypothetical protein